jgi:hypothetical protein
VGTVLKIKHENKPKNIAVNKSLYINNSIGAIYKDTFIKTLSTNHQNNNKRLQKLSGEKVEK